ncbi:reverse transcriptase domain-containing protein [Kordiimonas sp.]|uniref:reverse transcriptase domain-containing protein n=1 Tax=Kordiimonas sp. TaxID=1970157 RepID=UPI003A906B03
MKTTRRFFEYDYNNSLFPMRTAKSFARRGIKRALEFSEECVSSQNATTGFTQQTKAFASKPGFHLRRTVKLDPLAEIFLYDKMFKNKGLFLEPKREHCKHFGYRFTEDGRPLSATESYGGFRKAQTYYEKFHEERGFKFSLSFDVASYFNSMRHNDLIDWFQHIGASSEDVRSLDVFLAGIAPDRSSDCWPQGIYPTKMMGADFLRVIEEDIRIKAKARIRFLDDFVLFSDSEDDLIDDFFLIQKILGTRGLSVNASKTIFKAHDKNKSEVQQDIDQPIDVRKQLVEKKHFSVQQAYASDFDESSPGIELTDEERDYIARLLESKELTEDDADLIVSLARGCEREVKKAPTISCR